MKKSKTKSVEKKGSKSKKNEPICRVLVALKEPIEQNSYTDKHGNKIPHYLWELLLKDMNYRIVKNELHNNLSVSTIWLGYPHLGGFLFETTIFDINKREILFSHRYVTLEKAMIGHDKIIEVILKNEMPFNPDIIEDAIG